MPAVVAVSKPVAVSTTRVVSTPIVSYRYPYSYGYGYNYPYSYGYGYGYPYNYSAYNYGYGYPLYNSVYSAPIYQAPIYAAPAPTTIVVAPESSTTYGTCKATTGVGVTSNQCAAGKVAASVSGNGCMCVDSSSGLAGCGNVLNGICK